MHTDVLDKLELYIHTPAGLQYTCGFTVYDNEDSIPNKLSVGKVDGFSV